MARKHGGRGGGRSKHRDPGFRTSCKACQTIVMVITRPPAGIDLYCVPCDAKKRATAAAAAASA